jgi:mono/diheme cytochrome c family protein
MTRTMELLTRHSVLVGSIAAALLAGCSGKHGTVSPSPGPTYSSLANGQAIFQTGRDVDGVRISAQAPPPHGNCEACHRVDGSGGMRFPGGVVSADLRHRALVIQQKHPYNLALMERAIATGLDNEGKPLSPVMPRWRLSPRDLHDVAQYVLLKLK